MALPIDTPVREYAIEAYRQHKAANPQTTIAKVASDSGVGEASMKRCPRAAKFVSVAPKRPAGGGKPMFLADARKQFAECAVVHPTALLYEFVAYLAQTFGRRPHRALPGRPGDGQPFGTPHP